jgi:hypothetical protein
MGFNQRREMVEGDSVREWLGPHCLNKMDTLRGLSSRLMRSHEGGLLKVGVDHAATVDEHIHALLDLFAWHHYEVSRGEKLENRVQLAISRGANTESALPPLRTLRMAHTGSPHIELFVEREDGYIEEDFGDPPIFDGPEPARYAGYLESWYSRSLIGLPAQLMRSSLDSDRLRLYPQLSASPTSGRWSLRVDGLQVGEVGETSGILGVGQLEISSQKAAQAFREVIGGASEFTFSKDSVGQASELIHGLVERLGYTSGELLDHGVPEHALESTMVRGDRRVTIGGRTLYPVVSKSSNLAADDSFVAYGSQIPTLWSPAGRPRYLDAVLHDGRVPWAVEMKVKAGGGYGAYLRHAIGQAVLYRHFLRTAGAYKGWFESNDLDQDSIRALVLYPQPTEPVQRKIAGRIGNLWLTAAAFDVQVATVNAGWLH